jgi:ornithine carbamoyltransferase
MTRHLLTLGDLSADEIREIIATAVAIKAEPATHRWAADAKGLLLLFEKTSTRTSLSFQSAMARMGGYSVVLDWEKSNFAISPIKHEAQYASRNSDLIVARLKSHADLEVLAANSDVPVINGCDDLQHPSQALADFLTIHEIAGSLDGIHVGYVGVHNNVANSLLEGCLLLGIRFTLVTPIVNEGSRDDALLERARASDLITWSDDLSVLDSLDFVYTDTWIDMENFDAPDYADEKSQRIAAMTPFQLNHDTVRSSTTRVMHDMPIHPGFEISDELVDDPRSIIYQQAENRMHVEKALILHLLDG